MLFLSVRNSFTASLKQMGEIIRMKCGEPVTETTLVLPASCYCAIRAVASSSGVFGSSIPCNTKIRGNDFDAVL